MQRSEGWGAGVQARESEGWGAEVQARESEGLGAEVQGSEVWDSDKSDSLL